MLHSSFPNILNDATSTIDGLANQIIDLVEIQKPTSVSYAIQLTKIISKLSPMLGNLFEFRIVDELNDNNNFEDLGHWVRQDPGFPDARFVGETIGDVNIGVEIKAWFPFSTEITGRFKDSEAVFANNLINVAIVAWLPEYVFWGKPVVLKALVVSGKSVAEARDRHYHNPPHYLVFEPEDTSNRTGNLQQTNTNGYVFQDEASTNKRLYEQALNEVNSWGKEASLYSFDEGYQQKLKSLLGKYPYRLDTNYAKIDRIEHTDIELFKEEILEMDYCGRKVREWKRIASLDTDDEVLIQAIQSLVE